MELLKHQCSRRGREGKKIKKEQNEVEGNQEEKSQEGEYLKKGTMVKCQFLRTS